MVFKVYRKLFSALIKTLVYQRDSSITTDYLPELPETGVCAKDLADTFLQMETTTPQDPLSDQDLRFTYRRC